MPARLAMEMFNGLNTHTHTHTLSLSLSLSNIQYSLGVKRDEIKKLEDIARVRICNFSIRNQINPFILPFSFQQAEEKKLEAAEKYLEQSASMFDEFLKENDKNSVEAIKM